MRASRSYPTNKKNFFTCFYQIQVVSRKKPAEKLVVVTSGTLALALKFFEALPTSNFGLRTSTSLVRASHSYPTNKKNFFICFYQIQVVCRNKPTEKSVVVTSGTLALALKFFEALPTSNFQLPPRWCERLARTYQTRITFLSVFTKYKL